jgi:hypothetical protein
VQVQLTSSGSGGSAKVAASTSRPSAAFVPRTTLTLDVPAKDAHDLKSVSTGTAAGGTAMQYGFRDVGTLIPTPAAQLASLTDAKVTTQSGLVTAAGSAVLLQDAVGVGLRVTAAPAGDGSVRLTATPGQPDALKPPLTAPIRLLADLISVSQGTTVSGEILGDGDPTAIGQTFVLSHSPLIYLPPAQPGGFPPSTLTVMINGVDWQQVVAFRGQAADATVYVASQLPDGTTQVRFGDGINGARLPLGVANVTATYRYGPSGTPPPPGRLSTVLQPQPNLASVSSPVALTPGTQPETASQTFQSAPATVLLLSPAGSAPVPPVISLTDCEKLAATVASVSRVRVCCTADPDSQGPAITIYVGGPDEALAAVSSLLATSELRVPLVITQAQPVDLNISCEVVCPASESADAIKTAATKAVAELFSPGRMGIGQRLYRSQVAAALAVPGVNAVLGLRIRRSVAADPTTEQEAAHRDEQGLDPGSGGYFSLPSKELSIGVVLR